MAYRPANINELVQEIQSSGLAYSNRYEVVIYTPRFMGTTRFGLMRSLAVRCDSVTIPGRSLATTPFRIYGPARNMPYEQVYSGEVNLSVILSEDLRERKFFEEWMAGVSSIYNYKMGFYNDYTTIVDVDVLNRQDQGLYTFTIEEVYPKAIGDIQVGYDKDNEFMRQDITLSFRKYTTTYFGNRPKGGDTTQPTQPSATATIQRFVPRAGGGIDRIGPDGTVNGILGG
jgi:hypothetical protein